MLDPLALMAQLHPPGRGDEVEVTGQEAASGPLFAEEAEGRLATLSELLLELELTARTRSCCPRCSARPTP